jgi:Uma2 family endonuclease
MRAIAKPTTLLEFLEQPETTPASEFCNGETIQKPMPQGEHSALQGDLCETINQAVRPPKIARAFPELRCTFGGRSIVPDIAVFRWERIPIAPSGRIDNRFSLHPDWAIEILSPDQNQTLVLDNLLHCSQHGTELGWLLDARTETILVVLPDQRVQLLRGNATLPMLEGIELVLRVEQIFGWLTL